MSIPKVANPEEVKIDAYRGLGAFTQAYEKLYRFKEHKLAGQPRQTLEKIAGGAVAHDVNLEIAKLHGAGADAIVSHENVVLAKRCSAVFKIAARDYNAQMDETGGAKNALVIKPSYVLLRDSFADLGWKIQHTDDFSKIKSTRLRLANIRKCLAEAKIGGNEITALVINSPNNPTCEIYEREFISGLLQIMRDNPKLHIFSDVVYKKVARYDGVIPTVFLLAERELRGRIREAGGISKSHMPGDKGTSGYLYTSAEAAKKIKERLASGQIADQKSHRMNERRLLTLIAAMESPPEHFTALHNYYDAARAEIEHYFYSNKTPGLKIINPGNINFLLFDFSSPLLKNAGITAEKVVHAAKEKYNIRLLEPERIGSENLLRISVGSVFVFPELAPLKYNADHHRIEPFHSANDNRNYRGWHITSDLEVHKYIVDCVCNIVREMQKNKSLGTNHAETVKRTPAPRSIAC